MKQQNEYQVTTGPLDTAECRLDGINLCSNKLLNQASFLGGTSNESVVAQVN